MSRRTDRQAQGFRATKKADKPTKPRRGKAPKATRAPSLPPAPAPENVLTFETFVARMAALVGSREPMADARIFLLATIIHRLISFARSLTDPQARLPLPCAVFVQLAAQTPLRCASSPLGETHAGLVDGTLGAFEALGSARDTLDSLLTLDRDAAGWRYEVETLRSCLGRLGGELCELSAILTGTDSPETEAHHVAALGRLTALVHNDREEALQRARDAFTGRKTTDTGTPPASR